MTSHSSRGRVAAALAVALLAGATTAWLTRPTAVANPGADQPNRAPMTMATAPPDGPVDPSSPAGSPGSSTPKASSPTSPKSSPTTAPTTVPLLGRPVPVLRVGEGKPPTTFAIERLGISMDVKPQGVGNDGEMALAPNPADIGWYRYGSRPGDPVGATVFAAHVDAPGYGIGPLAQARTLRKGDVVTVASGSVVRRYTVERVSHIKKTALDLGALFTRVGPPLLHIVTCGGNFDEERRHYDENIVVVAIPMR